MRILALEPYYGGSHRAFLDAWIDLARREQTIQRLYDYWIQGKTGQVQPPRWSVIRDVLGWVD